MTTLEQLIKNTNYDHCQHVSKISKILALKFGYSVSESDLIGQTALYHDVGKTVIPPNILNKPGMLTSDEFEIVKTHTEAGYDQIMEVANMLILSASVAREHHERLDGSGYLKMVSSDINPYAKLISVADVFDALISNRPYKESWNVASTVQYLRKHKNLFDPTIVNCLVSVMQEVLCIYKAEAHKNGSV